MHKVPKLTQYILVLILGLVPLALAQEAGQGQAEQTEPIQQQQQQQQGQQGGQGQAEKTEPAPAPPGEPQTQPLQVQPPLTPPGRNLLENYPPVTQEVLTNPPPEIWPMWRRTYDAWGYSPLDQITSDNVQNMSPVWTFSTGVNEGHESPPIVYNGVMFVTTPQNQVIALDAATGVLLWRYDRTLPSDFTQLHPTNRGVGLWGNKVFVAFTDTYLVALDAQTGEVVWEKQVADHRQGYYLTLAPLIAHGNVMIGVSGGEYGIRGFIQAFDAESGDSLWKTYTIPGPGEPGNETWPGETWKYGGGSVWITGSYDPELNLSYWGIGNAAPWPGDARPGENLYTTSVMALDVESGELRNYFQYHWNDSWDWDEVSTPMLIDFERDGQTHKGLVHVGRNAYLWFLERSADELSFVDAMPYVFQNVFKDIDPETGRPSYYQDRKPGIGETVEFCPSLWGGKDWPPAAFNPNTRYLYIPANENLCGVFTGRPAEYVPGETYIGANTDLYLREGWDHIGEVQAWNVDTGEQIWEVQFPTSHNWGPILTTGGNLVFSGGTNDRYFRAYDAETGEVLWQFRTNSGIISVPTSFEVDGVQYIAVQSGWGVDAVRMQNSINDADASVPGYSTPVPQGGVVWVFALPDALQQQQQRQDQQQGQTQQGQQDQGQGQQQNQQNQQNQQQEQQGQTEEGDQ